MSRAWKRTGTSSLKGLRVFVAEGHQHPTPVEPPPGTKRYWTRRGVAEWLVRQLAEGPPTIVGIDHGFSFPEAYFKRHRLPPDWRAFLSDFHAHWPTDDDHVAKSLSDADHDGRLVDWCTPMLDEDTTAIARYEGWILGA